MNKTSTKTRITNQRLKILEHLKSVKTHPTAEMVYEAVKKELPAISLATVYRNLNLLADRGDILKFEADGGARFDGDTCSHQHCICSRCGKISDVFQKGISQYAMRNLDTRDFSPSCVTIIFTGLCRSCR
ncbi:transcriptional repressor [Candidatus Woesearchaeota archaeon]|nr:transcriptional repressor [Candidatus Woesearchaeota archaeon]